MKIVQIQMYNLNDKNNDVCLMLFNGVAVFYRNRGHFHTSCGFINGHKLMLWS